MKNVIRVSMSLIAAATIGLNGCGSSSSSAPVNPVDKESGKIKGVSQTMILGTCNDYNKNYICDNEESGNIEQKDNQRVLIQLQDRANVKYNEGKFSLAFDRNVDEHELLGIFAQTDIKGLENLTLSSDLTEPLLNAIKNNLNSLGDKGVTGANAQQANIEALAQSLISLNIKEFDNDISSECKNNETCINKAIGSLETSLNLETQEAYNIAQDVRGGDKILTGDKLVKEFTCTAEEIREVKHYGLEDLFSLANGIENATASSQVVNNPSNVAYNNNVNASFVDYDEPNANRLFGEFISGLPSGITKGQFYIGLKSNGTSLQGNDTLSLANIDADATTTDIFSSALNDLNSLGWNNQLISNTNPTTDIYWNNFSNITLNDNSTLLTYVNTYQNFDVTVQDDTSVDFITVATCSKPNPIQEITQIVDKFECSETEQLVKIIGGTIDAFNPTADAVTTPSNTLETTALNNTVYSNLASYDYTKYDYHFVDTLSLANINGIITKAELNVGYKVIGSSLHSNDAMYVGDYGTNHAGGHFYDNVYPLAPQGWTLSAISNGEYIAQANLANINNTTGSGNIFDTMLSTGYLDIYVQDDTAVDFTQLNLCVGEPCGEVYDINLTQAAQYSGDIFTELEPSSLPSNDYTGRLSWAPSMSWFDFSGNNQNENNISIEICACDDISLNVTRLKADNSAKVYLDNILVVDHFGQGQSTFIEDAWQNNSGITGSGTANISIPAGVPQTHILKIEVKDSGVVTGVAIEGTLSFRGYLGKCTQ